MDTEKWNSNLCSCPIGNGDRKKHVPENYQYVEETSNSAD